MSSDAALSRDGNNNQSFSQAQYQDVCGFFFFPFEEKMSFIHFYTLLLWLNTTGVLRAPEQALGGSAHL